MRKRNRNKLQWKIENLYWLNRFYLHFFFSIQISCTHSKRLKSKKKKVSAFVYIVVKYNKQQSMSIYLFYIQCNVQQHRHCVVLVGFLYCKLFWTNICVSSTVWLYNRELEKKTIDILFMLMFVCSIRFFLGGFFWMGAWKSTRRKIKRTPLCIVKIFNFEQNMVCTVLLCTYLDIPVLEVIYFSRHF